MARTTNASDTHALMAAQVAATAAAARAAPEAQTKKNTANQQRAVLATRNIPLLKTAFNAGVTAFPSHE